MLGNIFADGKDAFHNRELSVSLSPSFELGVGSIHLGLTSKVTCTHERISIGFRYVEETGQTAPLHRVPMTPGMGLMLMMITMMTMIKYIFLLPIYLLILFKATF